MLIKKTGGQLGEILIKMRFISEERMLSNLAAQLRIPFLDMQDVKIEAELVTKVNQAVAERHDLMPIAIKDGILHITMANPLNIFAIDEVTIQSEMDVETAVASQEDFDRTIQEHYGVAASINAAMKSIGALDLKNEESQAAIEGEAGSALEEGTADTPVAKLVEIIFKQALDDGAIDIYIEPEEGDLAIRYRIDGVLFKATSPPKGVESALIFRIKVLANMDISETRAPYTGGFSAKLEGKEIELRIFTCPTIYGENVVLRILDKSKLNVDLKDSGLMGSSLKKFSTLLSKPYGVILATGPTGSGKITFYTAH